MHYENTILDYRVRETVPVICLPGQPGDVLSPIPSPAEGGDYYEYIRGIHGHPDHGAADCGNSESEK